VLLALIRREVEELHAAILEVLDEFVPPAGR
jgi:hypothetical protein